MAKSGGKSGSSSLSKKTAAGRRNRDGIARMIRSDRLAESFPFGKNS